jgi:hypothetical protein
VIAKGQVYAIGGNSVEVLAVDGTDVTYRLDGRVRSFVRQLESFEAWIARMGATLR